MYIITRYVIWEVLKLFLAALVALTLVVTLGMGVSEGLKRGLPALVILRMMPFMLPEILGITLPASMLFSVCSVFGRMTGANEVVALKSLGISPMAVVWPAIVLAAFLSLGTVWMYEIAATWCKPQVKRVIIESVENIVYGVLQKNKSIDGERYDLPFSILVKRVDKRKLIQPYITLKGPPKVTISAAEGEIRADLENHMLYFTCTQGEVEVQGQMRMSFSDTQEYSTPIVIPPPDRYHRDWVAMRTIPGLIVELQNTLGPLQQQREANAAQGISESPQDAKRIDDLRFRIFRLRTEPYRRWANGFTCLCFALIGIPVAMLWRHADVLTNFFVCFLPILAVYYPLLMLGEDFSTTGKLPPISFWTANVVITIPAIALLRQMVKR